MIDGLTKLDSIWSIILNFINFKEQIGEGGTVHITKTIIGGRGEKLSDWSRGLNNFFIAVTFHQSKCCLITGSLLGSRISTTEETFQSHFIDSTIFQTKSSDVLSEFA